MKYMQQTNEQLINVIEEEFKLGHKLIRINGSSEIVKLGEIEFKISERYSDLRCGSISSIIE